MSDPSSKEVRRPAVSLPSDIPAEVVPFLEQMGYLDADRLQMGDQAPRLTLEALHGGEPAVIGDTRAPLPTVLIFGSYT